MPTPLMVIMSMSFVMLYNVYKNVGYFSKKMRRNGDMPSEICKDNGSPKFVLWHSTITM